MNYLIRRRENEADESLKEFKDPDAISHLSVALKILEELEWQSTRHVITRRKLPYAWHRIDIRANTGVRVRAYVRARVARENERRAARVFISPACMYRVNEVQRPQIYTRAFARQSTRRKSTSITITSRVEYRDDRGSLIFSRRCTRAPPLISTSLNGSRAPGGHEAILINNRHIAGCKSIAKLIRPTRSSARRKRRDFHGEVISASAERRT